MLREWSRADTARFLRAPGAEDDKLSRGVVALRTGSAAYPGAAVLGVEAAWRAGAGYVRYVGEARDAVLARRPETVVAARAEDDRIRPDSWVIGSGADAARRRPEEWEDLRAIVAGRAPVVVDAGALDLAAGAAAPVVVTPHAREFARLRDLLGLQAERSRSEAAIETAQTLGAVVLLKGAQTLVADPDGAVLSIRSAPAWLATAGAGDVLAGVLGTLIAANRDRPLAEVAAAAAWLHGNAAAVASGAVRGATGHPIVALDVAEALPQAIGDLIR